jgi:exodeoxyribonuclease VII small subunit
MIADEKTLRFEDQLENLEQIVAQLEDDEVGLEEALDLFERGMELARACRSRLEKVEQRVTQLMEQAKDDGSPALETLEAEQ